MNLSPSFKDTIYILTAMFLAVTGIIYTISVKESKLKDVEMSYNKIEIQQPSEEMQYLFRVTWYRVIDGDTIEATLALPFNISITEKFRLYGINAYRIRGTERPQGLRGKEFLESVLNMSKDIRIQTLKGYKSGKYGRYLAVIWSYGKAEKTNINELLVQEGHAISMH